MNHNWSRSPKWNMVLVSCSQQPLSFARCFFPVRWWASIFALLHCKLQTSQKLNDISFSTLCECLFPLQCSARVFLLLHCKLQSLQKYNDRYSLASSTCRSRKFRRCLLPLRWFSNSDWRVHLAWQRLHVQVGAGPSSSCCTLFRPDFTSGDA